MWPKLAGQQARYIVKELNDFKSGARVNAQMSPQAAPLSEQDMLDLAAYFSSQQQSGGTADPKAAKLGAKLYRAGDAATGVPACSGCHTPTGGGLGLAKFPRLSGQHAQYVEQTLKYFRAGERANDPNGMMRGVAVNLTDKQIVALAQYVQGLAAK
jgi:cytochrome c553